MEDERYKRAMIYTIRNIKDDTMVYVGSTINSLSKRFWAHKKDCKLGTSVSLYSYIDNNDWTDWYIELYEACPCRNKRELERREGEIIRQIGTINKCIAGRSEKEYREDNAEKYKEYNKKYKKEYYKNNIDKVKEQHKKYREENADKLKEKYKKYYEDNIDKIKEYKKEYYKDNANIISEKRSEKVCCDICGAFSTKPHLARHQRSKKCMSKSLDNTDIPSDNHI